MHGVRSINISTLVSKAIKELIGSSIGIARAYGVYRHMAVVGRV